MIEIRVNLQWYGNQTQAQLRLHLFRGVNNAVKFLKKEIKNYIGSAWGSVPFIGNFRKRVRHSSPGQPPLMQTGNLENSIQDQTIFNGTSIVGSVWADAPYAESLELGGLATPVSVSDKKYTNIMLINPIKNAIIIAARPFMLPMFMRNINNMIQLIIKG